MVPNVLFFGDSTTIWPPNTSHGKIFENVKVLQHFYVPNVKVLHFFWTFTRFPHYRSTRPHNAKPKQTVLFFGMGHFGRNRYMLMCYVHFLSVKKKHNVVCGKVCQVRSTDHYQSPWMDTLVQVLRIGSIHEIVHFLRNGRPEVNKESENCKGVPSRGRSLFETLSTLSYKESELIGMKL